MTPDELLFCSGVERPAGQSQLQQNSWRWPLWPKFRTARFTAAGLLSGHGRSRHPCCSTDIVGRRLPLALSHQEQIHGSPGEVKAGAPAPVDSVVSFRGMARYGERGEVQAVAVIAVTDGRELLSGRFKNNHWAALLAAHDMSRHNMLTAAYSLGRRAS